MADENQVLKIIKDELKEVRDKFGDDRRTEISLEDDSMEIGD